MSQAPLANTTAKQAIMDRLRTRTIDGPELPEVDPEIVIEFDDPIEQFSTSLAMVGGEAHLVKSESEVTRVLNDIEVFQSANRIASMVPASVQGNIDIDPSQDPHGFSNVDWTIAKGEFMVAENGAIWVDGASLPHRVLLFIAQYLAIVVSKDEIVSNMHQAYERLDEFNGPFGVFVSGPSKTADIEQSLVLGAHGCRKLQVFIVGE